MPPGEAHPAATVAAKALRPAGRGAAGSAQQMTDELLDTMARQPQPADLIEQLALPVRWDHLRAVRASFADRASFRDWAETVHSPARTRHSR